MKKKYTSEQLNIAMIGQKHIPSFEGGVEVVVEALSTRMVKLGHKVTCYNRMVKDRSTDIHFKDMLSDYKGVHLKYVPTIERRGAAQAIYTFLATIAVCFHQYDIVHFHAEGPAFMCWLPKLFGKRVIVTIHGLDHLRQKWRGFSAWCIKRGERMAVRYADEIIVLSENLKDYFNAEYNRSTVYIPNGIEVAVPNNYPADLIKKQYNIDKDSYFLYLGRIVPEKGLDYLVDAYKKLDTDKKLILAGGSYDAWDYDTQIRSRAEGDSRIAFIGFVEGQIKAELLSNAYAFILPSDLEGMPMSLLEAMTFGNCCVTSDIPECTEVLGESGLFFEKGNADSLNMVLAELCNSKETVEEFRKRVRETIFNKLNWDEVTEETIALYTKSRI